METKKPWESKTLIINLVMAITVFFPGAQAFIAAHPSVVVDSLVVVKDKVSIS